MPPRVNANIRHDKTAGLMFISEAGGCRGLRIRGSASRTAQIRLEIGERLADRYPVAGLGPQYHVDDVGLGRLPIGFALGMNGVVRPERARRLHDPSHAAFAVGGAVTVFGNGDVGLVLRGAEFGARCPPSQQHTGERGVAYLIGARALRRQCRNGEDRQKNCRVGSYHCEPSVPTCPQSASIWWRCRKNTRTRLRSPTISPSERKAKNGISISSTTTLLAMSCPSVPPPNSASESVTA